MHWTDGPPALKWTGNKRKNKEQKHKHRAQLSRQSAGIIFFLTHRQYRGLEIHIPVATLALVPRVADREMRTQNIRQTVTQVLRFVLFFPWQTRWLHSIGSTFFPHMVRALVSVFDRSAVWNNRTKKPGSLAWGLVSIQIVLFFFLYSVNISVDVQERSTPEQSWCLAARLGGLLAGFGRRYLNTFPLR